MKATIPPLALRIKKKKTNINTDPVNTVNDASATAVSSSTTALSTGLAGFKGGRGRGKNIRPEDVPETSDDSDEQDNELEQPSESEAGGDEEVEADDEEDEEEAMYEEYEEGRRSNRRLENLFKSQRQILFLFIFYPILSFSM